MTLDPGMVWLLGLVEKAAYPALETLSVAEARAQYLETANKLDRKPLAMDSVGDFAIERPGKPPHDPDHVHEHDHSHGHDHHHGTADADPDGGDLRVRLYRPHGLPESAPALLWFHGGGWVVGSVDTTDAICRGLAGGAACVVVSVEYRTGPEHPFPAAIEDGEIAWIWLQSNADALGLDPARIAIGGDSAGGNIAAVLAHLRKADPVPPSFQLLIYPATDAVADYPSKVANAKGYLLDDTTVAWFRQMYFPDPAVLSDPRASPLLFDDFTGLAPAHLQTAGYDPLCDEGVAYAEKMSAAGVAVDHRHAPGLLHGYFNMSGAIETADAAFGDAVAALKRGLAG